MKRWAHFAGRFYPVRKFRIDAGAYLLGALAVLLLPLNWLFFAAVAAAVHECGHLIALKLCDSECVSFHLGSTGAAIETEALSPIKETLCALAGPIGSFALLLFAGWMPRIALCAAIQGIFNLLPVYPLDGGRVIRGILRILLKNRRWEVAASCIEWLCMGLLIIAAGYCTFIIGTGYLPLMIAAFLVIRVFSRKIPCKETQVAVQ